MTSRFEPNLGGNWYVIVQDCRPRFADHNLSIRVCMGRRLELILMCFIPEHAIDPQSLFAIQYPFQFIFPHYLLCKFMAYFHIYRRNAGDAKGLQKHKTLQTRKKTI